MSARRWLLVLAGLTGALAATVLAGIPTVHQLPMWFWPLGIKAISPGWGVAAALCAGLAAAAAWVPDRRALALLVLAAAGIQLSLAWGEGRGEAGLRDRAVHSGHAEFVRLAASGVPAALVATRYEALAENPNTQFVPSKPPGQLLLYIGLERASAWLGPAAPTPLPPEAVSARHWRFVRALTYALPWLAALALLPLAALGRALVPEAGWGPAALFAVSAPLALITLHFDQAIYPGLAATLWWLAARAGASEGRGAAWGLAAGALSWLSAYVSFGLLPAVALAPVVTWAAAPRAARPRRCGQLLGGAALGAGLGWTLTAVLTGYDPVLRYQNAMAYHAAWKGWTPTVRAALQAAALNLVEFLWWAGPAVAVLLGIGVARSARRLLAGEGMDLLVVTLAAGLLALALAGRGVGESARLWLFLLPLVTLIAARTMAEVDRAPRWMAGLVGLQFLWTLSLKIGQDFW